MTPSIQISVQRICNLKNRWSKCVNTSSELNEIEPSEEYATKVANSHREYQKNMLNQTPNLAFYNTGTWHIDYKHKHDSFKYRYLHRFCSISFNSDVKSLILPSKSFVLHPLILLFLNSPFLPLPTWQRNENILSLVLK
jgi:hypothetical protein